jgi:hypothetical protein
MMEHETPVKRPRTAESSAANHLYYRNSVLCIDETTTIHIRQVLSRLQQAVTSKQRVAALHQLLTFIGYNPSTRLCRSPTAILSRFLEGKCIHLLCLQLGYVLSRRCLNGGGYDLQTNFAKEEVRLILISLDAFYRHCPALVSEDSIRNYGSEVLRLSQEVLVQHPAEMEGTNTNRSNGPDALGNVQPIVSIWHLISSCSLGTMLLLQNSATLQSINSILLSTQKKQTHHDIGRIEIIMECLGLLKNLSYYGEDYRHLIVDQTYLISTLTSLTDVPNDKARERLSAVFRNLALSAEVRSRLTQRADVLTAIVRIANFCISEPSNMKAAANGDNFNCKKSILRNILSTVTSLAIDTSTTHLMVFHGDGVLIEQLKQFVIHDEDFVARKRAVRALRLLARDPSSAPVMVLQNNKLLEILSDRALNDSNDLVRTEATEAFATCSNLIQAPTAQHNYILDALTRMLMIATTRTTTKPPLTAANLDVVARALQEQASYQINRRAITRQRNLLQALATVIRSENTTLDAKESVCATLVDLSEEKIDREAIALPIILGALVQTLISRPRVRASNDDIARTSTNIDTIVTNRIRESSVRTILNLAKTPSNRKDMAQQTELIQSLLRFAAATTTSEGVKKQVKAVILQLATEL